MGTTDAAQLKAQTQTSDYSKPRRRNCKETTISSSAVNGVSDGSGRCIAKQSDYINVVSSENSWSCPSPARGESALVSSSESPSSSSFRIRFSPGSLSPVMDFSAATANGHESFPSSFNKFNSALTAGLLNPMSPPPPLDPARPLPSRSSPTLFEMMASEPDIVQRRTLGQIPQSNGAVSPSPRTGSHLVFSAQDKQALAMQRISDLLANRSPGNQFNDSESSDVKLTLSSKDGISVSLNVHRQILVAHSRFFAVRLSDRWAKQQSPQSLPYIVEIADCDDVEVYIETLKLMYCQDLRKKLMREDVPRVLGILKVSAAIGFDAGVLSCLEYLEAAPWAEEEEEKVAALLSELRLENVGAGEVLKRVSVEVGQGAEESGSSNSDNEEVLLKLLHVVLEGKDEKARRDMKGLVSKMLRENSSRDHLRKESLYAACETCLNSLKAHFLNAADSDLHEVGQIARQADNLHWVLDILIDRQIAEDFLHTWATQSEMAEAHPKVPVIHRHEISRVTARLFVGIGKGQILAPKEIRVLLLNTWLVPFYDDFGWMRRASKGLDRHLIEDSLSNTILTLPLAWQQDILLAWFDRFLNSGEDCPNLQRAFEVWWKRAFWRRNGQPEQLKQLRITAGTVDNL